jgi:holo-ACP synthase CitX
MILSTELTTELKDLYQLREQRRFKAHQQSAGTLLQLSLNLPVFENLPAGANALFAWGLRQVLEFLPDVESCSHGHDRLGPWALLGSSEKPQVLKQQAVILETALKAGALLNIDIYDFQGDKLQRGALKLPPRRCILCDNSAADCLTANAHTGTELKARCKKLLASFRD